MNPRDDRIVAQLSIYPFHASDVLKEIMEFVEIFRSEGLKTEIQPLSTVVSGDTGLFFQALEKAYRLADRKGRFALVVTLSNATAV